MTCMRRLGKCLYQSCSVSVKLVPVFLCLGKVQRNTIPSMILYKQEYSHVLSGTKLHAIIVRCCMWNSYYFRDTPGNSDLQSRNNSSSDELQNKVIRLMTWQNAVLWHLFKKIMRANWSSLYLVAFLWDGQNTSGTTGTVEVRLGPGILCMPH